MAPNPDRVVQQIQHLSSVSRPAVGIDEVTIRDTIANFQAAFGRAEELTVNGKQVRIVIEKPSGMNETIRAVLQ